MKQFDAQAQQPEAATEAQPATAEHVPEPKVAAPEPAETEKKPAPGPSPIESEPQAESATDDAPPHAKPLLAIDEQIAHLKAKGVTFDLYAETDAADYLENANNLLRAASYRKLFPKQVEGANVGQYVNLDFAYLVDLSSIDRQLREALLAAAVDVEHFAKVGVLKRAEAEGEDGYAIVGDYLASLSHDTRRRILAGFRARGGEGEKHDTYSGDLIARYVDDYPIWVFFEICEFGVFVDFYRYCAERWDDRAMLDGHYILKSVKAARNAAAHNCCIANGLTASGEAKSFPISEPITRALNAAGMKNSKTRRKNLGNLRVAQIAAVLYSVNAFCTRESTLQRNSARFQQLKSHIQASMPNYRANNAITSSLAFIVKLIDIWLPADAE